MSIVQRVQLPPNKPDCCAECPLLGLVPVDYPRPKHSKETHLCLGTAHALSKKKTLLRASQKCDPKHPLKRPCDEHWDMWMTKPRHILEVNRALYRDSRLPYLSKQYPIIIFNS